MPEYCQSPQAGLDPVLGAAREVIGEQGTEKATIAEVARRAGVSRMTVYRRYGTWDRIVSDLVSAELADLLRAAEIQNQGVASVRGRAVSEAVTLTQLIASNDLLRQVSQQEPQWLVPLLTKRFGQTQLAAISGFSELLRTGMASFAGDGTVADTDPEVAAMTCLMICQPFVLAAPALETHALGAAIEAELPKALDAYLRPEIAPGKPAIDHPGETNIHSEREEQS